MIIGKQLSTFPQLDNIIGKIVEEKSYGTSIIEFVQTPDLVNQIMKSIIVESMKCDTIKKKELLINFEPLQQSLRKLHKTKRDAYVLSNALMYFNWNILNAKNIEELVIDSFLNSENTSHLTKSLFFQFKREVDSYNEDLHMEVQKKYLHEFLTVQDILSINNSKWEIMLCFARELQRKRKQEHLQALSSLNTTPIKNIKKKEIPPKKKILKMEQKPVSQNEEKETPKQQSTLDGNGKELQKISDYLDKTILEKNQLEQDVIILQNKNNSLQSQINSLLINADENKAYIATLQNKNNSLQSQVNTLQDKNNSLQSQVDILRDEYSEQKTYIATLQDKNNSLQSQVDNLVVKVDFLEKLEQKNIELAERNNVIMEKNNQLIESLTQQLNEKSGLAWRGCQCACNKCKECVYKH